MQTLFKKMFLKPIPKSATIKKQRGKIVAANIDKQKNKPVG